MNVAHSAVTTAWHHDGNGAVPPTPPPVAAIAAETEQEPQRGPGRPSLYSEDFADAFCSRIINGESLPEVCRDPEMPSAATVMRWLRTRPDFQLAYRYAVDAKVDAMCDQLIAIADVADKDELALRRDALAQKQSTTAQSSRIGIDARWRAMEKKLPRIYGTVPQIIPPEQPGDSARLINPPGMPAEPHWLDDVSAAWRKAIAEQKG